MKISKEPIKIICSNRNSLHNYFAWPSVARLRDGRLAMVASGFRLGHICPFGKGVICYSSDEGKTWTRPTPVIDTPLDDRDCGIAAFGESSFVMTSFNNTIQSQRDCNLDSAYINAYLNKISKEREKKYIGSTLVFSNDNGTTFSDIYKSPVTSPHGPCLLPDGNLLYVGRKFQHDYSQECGNTIACYKLYPDGHFEFLSEIENAEPDCHSCEPHAIVLKNGEVIVHIRVQNRDTFTTYQCESADLGKTFTKPHRLLGATGGAPAHLLQLSDGRLISVYGVRKSPYTINAMISCDDGKTWSTDHVLYENNLGPDLGYPCSVELNDGKILTVFYAHHQFNVPAAEIYPEGLVPAEIIQVIWKPEN